MLKMILNTTAERVFNALAPDIKVEITTHCDRVSAPDEPFTPTTFITDAISELDYKEHQGDDGNWSEFFLFHAPHMTLVHYDLILGAMKSCGYNKNLERF